MMNIKIADGDTRGVPVAVSKQRAINDLLYVYYGEYYINEKGYLTKLIDILYKLDYYKNNKSIIN